MATPVGHSLFGYAVYGLAGLTGTLPRGDRGVLVLALVMASAADLDFLPGLVVGKPALYHQGPSHSLGFALLAGLAGAAAYRPRGLSPPRIFVVGAMAYCSHLAIDLVCADTRPPIGVPLLWPLSDEPFIAPVTVFPGVEHGTSRDDPVLEWIASLLDLANVRAVLLEAALLGPVAWLARWRPCTSAAVPR